MIKLFRRQRRISSNLPLLWMVDLTEGTRSAASLERTTCSLRLLASPSSDLEVLTAPVTPFPWNNHIIRQDVAARWHSGRTSVLRNNALPSKRLELFRVMSLILSLNVMSRSAPLYKSETYTSTHPNLRLSTPCLPLKKLWNKRFQLPLSPKLRKWKPYRLVPSTLRRVIKCWLLTMASNCLTPIIGKKKFNCYPTSPPFLIV